MVELLLLFDVVACGIIGFQVVRLFFGDNPLGRGLSVLAAIAAGGYFVYLLANPEATKDWPESMIPIFAFGPIGLVLLLAFVGYVINGNNK